jgi:hypothetical protein
MLNGGYRSPELIAAERLAAAERELASLEAEVAELQARHQMASRALGEALRATSRGGPVVAGVVAGVALGFSLALAVLGIL